MKEAYFDSLKGIYNATKANLVPAVKICKASDAVVARDALKTVDVAEAFSFEASGRLAKLGPSTPLLFIPFIGERSQPGLRLML